MKKTTIVKTLALVLVISPILTSAAMLTRQLQIGMRGYDVGILQAFLAQDATIYPQGLVTNYFGYLTKSAVSNFQARNGISAVGRVGPQTLPVINAQMNSGMPSSNNTSRVIGQLQLNTSNNQVAMAWNTSDATAAAVYYGTSPLTLTEATDYSPFTITGGYNVVLNSDLRTSHSGTITGLIPNTTYYYVVFVKDAEGNISITLPATFTTTN